MPASYVHQVDILDSALPFGYEQIETSKSPSISLFLPIVSGRSLSIRPSPAYIYAARRSLVTVFAANMPAGFISPLFETGLQVPGTTGT
jgi:hypothetical protein